MRNEEKKEYSTIELVERFAKGYGGGGTLLEVCGQDERIYDDVASSFRNTYVIEHERGDKISKDKSINILYGDYKKIPMNKYNVIYFDCSMLNYEGIKVYRNEILRRNINPSPFVFLYTNSHLDVIKFLDEYYGKIYVNIQNKLFAIGIDEQMKREKINQ